MIIIGFCRNTSKILPKLFCKKFRHCAPIVVRPDGTLIMYQFERYKHIKIINLHVRDLAILGRHGWQFIYLSNQPIFNSNIDKSWTCVSATCTIAGIPKTAITPDGLYRKLHAL